MQGKIDIVQYAFARQSTDFQHRFTLGLRLPTGIDIAKVTPNHHGNQVADFDRIIIHGGNKLSITHDGSAIGYQRQFLQSVRDINDARSLFFK